MATFEKGRKKTGGKSKGYISGASRFKEFMEQEGGIDKLFALADSDKEAVQLEALKFITDRAYGKAPQALALKHSGSIVDENGREIPGKDFLQKLADRINAQRHDKDYQQRLAAEAVTRAKSIESHRVQA